jgi:hypothetical protein
MRSVAILLVLVCAVPAQGALLLYDGFAPVTPDPGTEFNYRPGEFLAPRDDTTGSPHPGQLVPAPYNVNWRYAGAGGTINNSPSIASGTLMYPGLAAGVGNSVTFDYSNSGTARAQFPVQTTGTLYWSAILRVNDVGTLSSTNLNGSLVGGFNNTPGPGATNPTSVGAVLRLKKDAADPNRYLIGTAMNSGTGAGNVQFSSTSFAEGASIFLVGAYEFVAGASNDKAYMWINPSPSTFSGTAPAPTLTSAPNLTDSAPSLATFNLRNINTVNSPNEPPFINFQFDELRVGTSWANITPTPEPSVLLIMGFVGAVIVTAGKNRNKLQGLFA